MMLVVDAIKKKKGMIDEYELISQSNLIFTHQNRSAITGESSI